MTDAPATTASGLGRYITVLQGIRPFDRSLLSRDVVAGITLAALAIPEVMGYTKIAGTPVVTVYAYNGANTLTSWYDGSSASGCGIRPMEAEGTECRLGAGAFAAMTIGGRVADRLAQPAK